MAFSIKIDHLEITGSRQSPRSLQDDTILPTAYLLPSTAYCLLLLSIL